MYITRVTMIKKTKIDMLKIAAVGDMRSSSVGVRRMDDKSSNVCSRAVCKLVVLVKFHPPMIDLGTEEVIDCW
jgi:hypothetical protein